MIAGIYQITISTATMFWLVVLGPAVSLFGWRLGEWAYKRLTARFRFEITVRKLGDGKTAIIDFNRVPRTAGEQRILVESIKSAQLHVQGRSESEASDDG